MNLLVRRKPNQNRSGARRVEVAVQRPDGKVVKRMYVNPRNLGEATKRAAALIREHFIVTQDVAERMFWQAAADSLEPELAAMLGVS